MEAAKRAESNGYFEESKRATMKAKNAATKMPEIRTASSRRAGGMSSRAHVSCTRHTHRRSASASWSSRPTTASRRAISRRQPARAAPSPHPARPAGARAGAAPSRVRPAEASCVCSVDVVAAWRVASASSAFCSMLCFGRTSWGGGREAGRVLVRERRWEEGEWT